LNTWTDGAGVDVLVQTLGGATWLRSLEHVSKLGRIVVCAAILGDDPPAGLGTLLWKQITVLGSTGGSPLDFADVIRLVRARVFMPIVAATFSLEDAGKAHAQFEKHEHIGKVLLIPESSR
jgi:NADPH:quinone reductase-like Zn-dependent oxidoreductase